MARFLGSLIIFIGSFLLSGYAQTPSPLSASSSSSSSSSSPTPQGNNTRDSTHETKLEEFKRSFEQLTPEQQQRFLQNYRRWEDLTPEEREILRQRQRLREKKRDEDTAEALQRSGLHLNEEGRERFRKRYQQERRKLEEQLLKETQERRQVGNAAIIEQLRREFSSAQTR